jgi:phosphoribosylamine---glycine ligase
MKHRILILGSGGREHAIAHSLSKSPRCEALFVAPGNAGTAEMAQNIELSVSDFSAVEDACIKQAISLVVVGPEGPLVQGVVDYFKKTTSLSHVLIVGPDQLSAQLEGSKDFAKAFMVKHGVRTASYATFTRETLSEGMLFLEGLTPPYVLKADGLAAGKGVLILDDLNAAKSKLNAFLSENLFGEAGSKVVIEEFLDGMECSCFVAVDAKHNYQLLPMAKDYKRIGEFDTGPNTGGMGAVSPVSFIDELLYARIQNEIVVPTVNGIKAENYNYVGFVFIGLMMVKGVPYVIEYNVRMGDPETEVVFPRIQSDTVSLLEAMCLGSLDGYSLSVRPETAATVVAVSEGYPDAYEMGKPVFGLTSSYESQVYHAGTALKEGAVVTSGGRVLAITSLGDSIEQALDKSYATLEKVGFDKMYFRGDIGKDLM